MSLFYVRLVFGVAILAATGQSFYTFEVSREKSSFAINAVPPSEESARVIREYMVKSHEDKLRALNEIEQKKQVEIEKLKARLESLQESNGKADKTNTPPSTPANDVESRQQQLALYEDFISKYIVEAHAAKLLAVREAEAAITAKYEAKILELKEGASKEGASEPVKASNEAYEARNSQVLAAAEKGKSRWGDQEVNRIAKESSAKNVVKASEPKKVKGEKATTDKKASTPKKKKKKKEKTPPRPLDLPPQDLVYLERNTLIANAGAQSRWGPMEVARAKSFIESAPAKSAADAVPEITVTPEIEAADHGMRADGGVGGPSLAERVNLGAEIMGR